MARRDGSTATLRLSADHAANDDAAIAPWLLDVPPTPPPKSPNRTFGFARKASFPSLAAMRQGSTSSLLRPRRPSESQPPTTTPIQSTLSVPSLRRSADDNDSSRTLINSASSISNNSVTSVGSGDTRKSKSSSSSLSVFAKLKTRASRAHLRSDSSEAEHPSLRTPAPPLPDPPPFLLPGGAGGSLASIVPAPLKKDRSGKKKKGSVPSSPPLDPTYDDAQHQYELDTNLERMDGIIDLSMASGTTSASGTNSGFESSSYSQSLSDHSHSNSHSFSHQYYASASAYQYYPSQSLLSSSDFRDPFNTSSSSSSSTIAKRRGERHVSPTTVLPLPPPPLASSTNLLLQPPRPPLDPEYTDLDPDDPSWVPPESWDVVPQRGDEVEEAGGEVSSSDESALGVPGPGFRARGIGVGGGGGGGDPIIPTERTTHAPHPLPPLPHPSLSLPPPLPPNPSLPLTPPLPSPPAPLPPRKPRRKPPRPSKPYILRIYRENNSYHVVSIAFNVTVANLTPALNKKLLLGEDRDIEHRLYLKERGRERVLAQTEKPADIVRRRLEQAGYDAADGLELLGGEGLSFLLKFVYKSQLLGPADEDIKLDNVFTVDLTGRSLRTIPVIVHQHATTIIVLKLSRNPMLEIPLDFIQSCTSLRELKLSNMAMKKVPQSVRHSSTLHRLDLSSNRISDLDEAYLDHIPDLLILSVQNNRIESLPWHFPRLRSLTKLNISNNKFRVFPLQATELEALTELDVSFNAIAELPEEIGNLRALRYLIVVGNQITRFPEECARLTSLEGLDCRRNQISDLSIVCVLPKIKHISADHNAVHALDLALGPNLTMLDTSYNDITQIALIPGPIGRPAYALTCLDLSHAKLSSLDDFAIKQLASLKTLRLDHNSFRSIPDTLGDLHALETLSCSDNKLDLLPSTIGQLQNLAVLDAHNNSLTELPRSLWMCARLVKINVTSNFLGTWHDPPMSAAVGSSDASVHSSSASTERKMSAVSIGSESVLPPLALSLRKLFLGENRLTDEVIRPLRILKELQVLNLSFNEIQDLPPSFFRHLTKLQELYLSGNKLTSFPTEDLPRLQCLSTVFLNGNKLHTLPRELAELRNLTILDVGSNLLKYNINNSEFDWNWNFNKKLKYLNLSGNNRLQIKADPARTSHNRSSRELDRQALSGFTDLTQLRVLGLVDVTITANGTDTTVDIPDENDDRRVRTSLSTVNGMAYGIADSLGQNEYLTMLDLVQEFPQRGQEAIFAMFGRSQPPDKLAPGVSPNKLTKFLHDSFAKMFVRQLDMLNPERGEGVPDALRRTFLKLNQDLHDALFANSRKMSQASASVGMTDSAILKSGASGIVLYFKGRTMYVANVGDALAVVSRQGVVQNVSRKHDPYDRGETARIRAAEGWVSPPGLVNDEVDVSRSFGYYHLLPIVNARPDVSIWELNEQDEFVIVANRGLWDFVSYQTAVDIARTVARTDRPDPTIAAQKLRDFAISYGADGSTMIMVIWVADLFGCPTRSREPTLDPIVEAQQYRKKKKDLLFDHSIARLDFEVAPPTGHIALVFTDIRNSTHLWEVNPGMATAMRLHNSLLRRQLRFCGGYEVKTEGDAFMCSFPTALAAVWWALSVQNQLLHEPWPLEILECEDGKAIHDNQGRLIARGLSVRMGIHCGMPVCEPDPITHRMDYFGPMVNRCARINGSAAGGQIMCSAEIIREINARILETEPETEFSRLQPQAAIDAIRRTKVEVIPVGEVRLKGLELPEFLSVIYPLGLEGRHDLKEEPADATASASRVQFSIMQMRELGSLCLRLEALATGRIFKALPERKGSIQTLNAESNDNDKSSSIVITADPSLLLPTINDKSPDSDLMMVLDSLSVRIQNALASITQKSCPPTVDRSTFIHALTSGGGLDERTLQYIASVLHTI